MRNSNCNICNQPTKFSSKIYTYISKDNINWIHDSILFIIKKKQVKVSMIFCLKCIHSTLLPKYDTMLLYNNSKKSVIRKKFFQKYNKNLYYGNITKNKNLSNKKIKNEFKRIFFITQEITNFINYNSNNKTQVINLLDWGGGLGHIFNITKNIIESTNNIKINCSYYDPLSKKSKKNIPNKKYDFILISHVLEHIHDLNLFFKQIDKFVDKKTKLIIEVPDERFSILSSLFFNKKISLQFHVNIFTKSSLQTLLFKNGYFSKLSYKNSFYRGNKMLTILGVAYKKDIYNFRINKFYEFFSFLYYFIRKIINKF